MRIGRAGLLIVLVLAAWSLTAAAESRPLPFEALVKWVADGDTVTLDDGRRLRYVGINCPEVAHENVPPEPFGAAAGRMNRNLVLGKKIRCVPAGQDRYGRLLGAVFLSDGTFVNQALVAAGLAYALPCTESKPFADRIIEAQRQAMAHGNGFWKHLDRTPVPLVGNRRSQRFHRSDCKSGIKIGKHQRVTFPDLYQAFAAGYAPCGRCFPRFEQMMANGCRQ